MGRIFFIILFFVLCMPVANLQASSGEHESPHNGASSFVTNENIAETIEETISTKDEVEKSAGLPQFDTSTFTSQLFWLAISFSVLYLFFAKSTLPSISSTLEIRQSTIKNDYDQADKLSLEADTIKTNYEAEIIAARQKANLKRQSEEQSFRAKTDVETKNFNDHSMDQIKNIENKVSAKQDQIKSELDAMVTELVQEIVNKIVDTKVSEKDVLKIVQSELSIEPKQTKKAA